MGRSFFARLFRLRTDASTWRDERAWRLGARGEQLVAKQLDRLGLGWHVLHSITLSETGTDLDHLVIGPAGVFSVNTKHHHGARVWVAGATFMVNGQRQSYIGASRSEGRRVARALSAATRRTVTVRPVIAVVGASHLMVKEQPSDVVVCGRLQVVWWLRSLPALVGPETVEAVFSAARRPATWVPDPPRAR